MKKEIRFTRRMYAGHPIFVALYYDREKESYNYTTLSSIYNLGKMVVVGSGKNNFLKCALKQRKFTLNFLSEDYLEEIKKGGLSGSRINKFEKSRLSTEKVVINDEEVVVIKQADLIYSCSLVDVFENEKVFPNYSNLLCNLNHVMIDDKHYNSGQFDVEHYEPLIFIGTDKGRFFRKAIKLK